ncbi:murein biosynthesis integral membrane protein MurJ [Bifidobacterium sp. ESL0790]|uniref:murein biosynthesis integral membrane protein MurJ n=1 Tax=Bifidobacterium sp. ESL0790 TaxID=2983233 RepID=UPI0023FA1496|nr:murein biosynthesis integral membrane protein MurJ [Bifidobacterium sp. ESL0790]WEV72464.1 murein biosynthesis integral membrane protein MurJ [Bifidobacterium sp. ESL0790]
MSSSVGHNSLVMAVGTAASRVTGQVRTILLAAALGTTGLAANAYQAGSTLPQVVFTLVSGGIFNAVLVPQIVRTLKAKDAQDRLNKLITFAIILLLGVTLLIAVLTPVLVRLYVNSGEDMLALTTSFTIWCVPQIFFYGLYTLLGQILAAKDHFGTYAWSSVGANVISCVGLTVFILMFGRASHQPLGYWTSGKIALTAGTWTLGVAFQALILFAPLTRIGLRYRPSWGVHGIGLRSMGSVAAWGVGIVVIDQIANVVYQRVLTSIPGRAMAQLHISEFDVAGNASYQNANTIDLLPYSLIAVSVATAVFPKIAQAIADHDVDSARRDLSESWRNVWLMMCFFTVAFVVMPVPITLALLPSISVKEAVLISGPLMFLSIGLPFSSTYLIVQRTFYAFEDGFHPFLFIAAQSGIQVVLLLVGTLFVSPFNWASLTAFVLSISYVLSYPLLFAMLRKRFDGTLDGRRIGTTFVKGIIASFVAIIGGLVMRYPTYALFHADIETGAGVRGGHMNWFQAVGTCAVLAIIILLLYVGTLSILRTRELTLLWDGVTARFGRVAPADPDMANMADQPAAARQNSSRFDGDAENRGNSTAGGANGAAQSDDTDDTLDEPDTLTEPGAPVEPTSESAQITPPRRKGPAQHHAEVPFDPLEEKARKALADAVRKEMPGFGETPGADSDSSSDSPYEAFPLEPEVLGNGIFVPSSERAAQGSSADDESAFSYPLEPTEPENTVHPTTLISAQGAQRAGNRGVPRRTGGRQGRAQAPLQVPLPRNSGETADEHGSGGFDSRHAGNSANLADIDSGTNAPAPADLGWLTRTALHLPYDFDDGFDLPNSPARHAAE